MTLNRTLLALTLSGLSTAALADVTLYGAIDETLESVSARGAADSARNIGQTTQTVGAGLVQAPVQLILPPIHRVPGPIRPRGDVGQGNVAPSHDPRVHRIEPRHDQNAR